MSVIDRVKEHFENQGVKKIEVPEWGEEGKPLIIYSKPFTMAEKRNLFKGARNDDLSVLVDVLHLKALDQDGNKLFKIDDKKVLLNKCDPDVLSRVASEMLASDTYEEAEKK